MAATLAELISQAKLLARVENDERARRWLATTCSILADWGGERAAALLKGALPSECFSGPGSSGRSWSEAEKAAGGDASLALVLEAELRSRQPDPRNVAMMLLPLIGLVKREIDKARGPSGSEELVAAMPAALQGEIRAASTRAPWAFRLIPQSYARPHRH